MLYTNTIYLADFLPYLQVVGVSCLYDGLDEPLAGSSQWTYTSLHSNDGNSRPESHHHHEHSAAVQTAQSRLLHRHTQNQQQPLEEASAVLLLVKNDSIDSVFYLMM